MIVRNCKYLLTAIVVIVGSAILVGCSSPKLKWDDDEEIPKDPDSKSELVSIAYLRSLYKNSSVLINEQIKIEGKVISDHRCGTFYKTIVIEDESGGIEIKVDTESKSSKYKYLDKVIIKCNSLTLGSYGGHLELGFASDELTKRVKPISADYLDAIIKIQSEKGKEEFTKLTIDQLSSHYLSCCVAFEGVQFVDDELGKNWSEAEEDANRHVVDKNGNILVVRTSYRANYANYILPTGSGMIFGILGVFNNQYQLTVINERELPMNNPRL